MRDDDMASAIDSVGSLKATRNQEILVATVIVAGSEVPSSNTFTGSLLWKASSFRSQQLSALFGHSGL